MSEYSLYIYYNLKMSKELSNRQKEIIKASLELISEHGIQNLTIKNLSRKIGLVESAIYRHYESKSKILVAIVDSIERQIESNDFKPSKSTMGFIEKKLKNHFHIFTENPALISVVFAEDLFQNEPLLVEKIKVKVKRSISELSELTKIGQENGEIRKDIDHEQVSIIINGSVRMLLKQWKMMEYSFDLQAKGNELIKSLKLLLKA